MPRPRKLLRPCTRCESRERIDGLTICERCRAWHRRHRSHRRTRAVLAFVGARPGSKHGEIVRACGRTVLPTLANLVHHGKIERRGAWAHGRYFVASAGGAA